MGSGAETDRDRLLQVAESVSQAAVRGRRLPVVQAKDAAGLVAIMHEQLDDAIAHRNRDAAEAGIVIACERGCNSCCQLPVVVGDPEAIAVTRWLDQPEQAAVRERFLVAYPQWRQKLGAIIEAVVAAPTLEEKARACAEHFSRHAMCPFNADGDCTIYPVRPALCRTAHALNSNAKCIDESAAGVDTLSHDHTDSTYESQDAIRTVLHQALRPSRALEMLPKAVMRRMTAATAFPNQPCPCGSGQKQKRCCGAG
jgi:Fe-S-cluster containining protein